MNVLQHGVRGVLFAALLSVSMAALGRTVSTGTVVANPGATVSVPVTIDDLSGIAASVVTVNYDSTVLVCLGVDAGAIVPEGKFTYLDSGNGRLVAIFSGLAGDGGAMGSSRPTELMRIRFSVRDATQGLFSDVTLADVQFGATDGVTDLSVSNPLTVVNGMVRVMSSEADATRLEEAFSVWPGTALKSLTLGNGDEIKAGSAVVRVAGAVTTSGAVRVEEPLGGWQTGRYALLATQTEGLTFVLGGAQGAARPTTLTVVESRVSGVSTYYADVVVDGSVEVVAEGWELDADTAAQVRETCAAALKANPAVTRVVVRGERGIVPVAVDLGIAPALDVTGVELSATYATPTLRITEFEPATGRARIKVTPGEGNAIRSPLATGCIHVYGTANLSEKMRYISGTSFDLTPYLNDETKGEADLTVALGTYTFIKIKAEKSVKQEGEVEQ